MTRMSDAARDYYPDRAYNCEIPEHLLGKRVRATWITYRGRSIWCCDFSAYEADPQGLLTELELSDTVTRQQPENSLLVAVVLYKTKLIPPIADFFMVNATRSPNPIRKMAVLFLPDVTRLWYQLAQRGVWPRHTAFLDDYEKAKAWLVGDSF